MSAWPLLGLVGSAAALMTGIASKSFNENIYTIALATCIPIAVFFLGFKLFPSIMRELPWKTQFFELSKNISLSRFKFSASLEI